MASKKKLRQRIRAMDTVIVTMTRELAAAQRMLRVQRRLSEIAYGHNCETCGQFVRGWTFETDQIPVPTYENPTAKIPGETHFKYQPCGHQAVL